MTSTLANSSSIVLNFFLYPLHHGPAVESVSIWDTNDWINLLKNTSRRATHTVIVKLLWFLMEPKWERETREIGGERGREIFVVRRLPTNSRFCVLRSSCSGYWSVPRRCSHRLWPNAEINRKCETLRVLSRFLCLDYVEWPQPRAWTRPNAIEYSSSCSNWNLSIDLIR